MRVPLRPSLPAAPATVAWLAVAASAIADAPRFDAATSALNDGGLVGSFDERGLANENPGIVLAGTTNGVSSPVADAWTVFLAR